jgi:hypothetical protein
VIRKKSSYDFKFDKNKNDYNNNVKNNMQDTLKLIDIDTNNILFECNNVQTVSNHPYMKLSDTIKAGKFRIKHFVDKRKFRYDIHGIVDAYDINNQKIDKYSMQHDNGRYIGRWLAHSTYDPVLRRVTRAFSGGCFIMSPDNIKRWANILKTAGVKKDTIIEGELIEK